MSDFSFITQKREVFAMLDYRKAACLLINKAFMAAVHLIVQLFSNFRLEQPAFWALLKESAMLLPFSFGPTNTSSSKRCRQLTDSLK